MFEAMGVCVLASLPAIAWLLWKRRWFAAVLIAIVGLGLAPMAWLLTQSGFQPTQWTQTELVIVAIAMTVLAIGIGGLIALLSRGKPTTTFRE